MEEGCKDQEITLLCKSWEVKMAFSGNNDLKLCTKTGRIGGPKLTLWPYLANPASEKLTFVLVKVSNRCPYLL